MPVISTNWLCFFDKNSGFVTIFYTGLAITCVNTYILYAKDNCHSPFIVVC
ncbi:hypothetical protein M917_1275 [Psychrobacter aquaticus CMS 56]|uniref:Uncharacterized protein n=1 Tax=Psychrobacter aquaticus CMS 56 TaxID=1354303 RepID=U4T3L7_9GAMM|nr:hypothetical protein M917_1275 [Psychrobacter aquaticus CMS 56]